MKTLNNNKESIDELLVKFLVGEANAKEKKCINDWTAESSENTQYFYDFKKIWENSKVENIESPSEDDAWNRFQQKVQVKNKRLFSTNLWKYAAAAAILIAISFYWAWNSNLFSQMQKVYASTTILTDTLPDNSVITLNTGSEIKYAEKFNGKKRKIWLQGEAFFDVARDEKRPFIIHIDNTIVTVLGTAFNIRQTEKFTTVIVKRGTVKVAVNDKNVILKAGNKTVVNRNTGKIKVAEAKNNLYNYYVTHSFICNNTPLSELIHTLSRAYNVKIVIANPKLENLPITTTFHRDQSINDILTIISETFDQVSFVKKGNEIIIK